MRMEEKTLAKHQSAYKCHWNAALIQVPVVYISHHIQLQIFLKTIYTPAKMFVSGDGSFDFQYNG